MIGLNILNQMWLLITEFGGVSMLLIVYELYSEYNTHVCKGVRLIMVNCEYEVYGRSAIMFELCFRACI